MSSLAENIPLEATGKAVSGLKVGEIEKELDRLFPQGKAKYHADYARILEFLSDTDRFDRVFQEVDRLIKARFELQPKNKQDPNDKHWFTRTIADLFQKYNVSVPRVFDIVLVGSAQRVFGSIIRNGFLFKDGTGPGHGEYTHTLQWLTIAAAASELKLEHNVWDLYKNSAGGPNVLTEGSLSTLTSEGTPTALKVAYWNYLVDCFKAKSERSEDVNNLFASNYRSPGYFSSQLGVGRLDKTWVAGHLKKRAEKREEAFKGKEEMRGYHAEKRKGRPDFLYHVGSEGVNTFFPEHLLTGEKSHPDFAKHIGTALNPKQGSKVALQKSGEKS